MLLVFVYVYRQNWCKKSKFSYISNNTNMPTLLPNITQNTKDRATRTPQKTGGELVCSGRVNMWQLSCYSCHISGDKSWMRTGPHYYISQLIRYCRACGSYHAYLDGGLLLTRKLLNKGYLVVKMKSSLRKFKGHHNYGISVSQMITNVLRLS
jgi:hypothetical protein